MPASLMPPLSNEPICSFFAFRKIECKHALFQASANLQQFMRSNALSPMVMVCTDRSSRGMDFERAEVSNAVNGINGDQYKAEAGRMCGVFVIMALFCCEYLQSPCY